MADRGERRRWERAIAHNFAPGEQVVAYETVKPVDGVTSQPIVATQYALYQPGISPDVRIAYEHIDGAAFDPAGAPAGVLRLALPIVGEVAYACSGRDLAQYVVARVAEAHA